MKAPLYTRRFWQLSLGHFLFGTAVLSLPVLALYVKEALGADPGQVGLVLSTAVLAGILFRPLYGTLLDRRGRRSAFLLGGVLTTGGFFLYPSVPDLGAGLHAVRFLHGIGIGGLFGTFFTYAVDLSPAGRRAEGIAVFGASGLAASGVGPVLGEAVARAWGWPAFFVTMGLLAAASLLLTLGLPETREADLAVPPGPGRARRGLGYALAHPPVAAMWPPTALVGAVFASSSAFVALLVQVRGLPSLRPYFLAYAAAAISTRVVGSRLLDAIGVARAVLPSTVPLAAGMVLLGRADEPWHLVLAGAAGGVGHGFLFPALGALATLRSDPAARGTVISVFTGVIEFGGLLGIPLCGWIAGTAGFGPMYLSLAAAIAAAAAWFAASEAWLARRAVTLP